MHFRSTPDRVLFAPVDWDSALLSVMAVAGMTSLLGRCIRSLEGAVGNVAESATGPGGRPGAFRARGHRLALRCPRRVTSVVTAVVPSAPGGPAKPVGVSRSACPAARLLPGHALTSLSELPSVLGAKPIRCGPGQLLVILQETA